MLNERETWVGSNGSFIHVEVRHDWFYVDFMIICCRAGRREEIIIIGFF